MIPESFFVLQSLQAIGVLVFLLHIFQLLISILDLAYCFKLQTGAQNSCWPVRDVYFLASTFSDKRTWVEKLQVEISKHANNKAPSQTCNPVSTP